MKKWLLPISVLGISGVGLLLSSERGREQVRTFLDRMVEHGDPLGEFSKFLDEQLAAMQKTLDSVAEALEQSRA